MDPHLLFPDLPAELRNIIYSNTIHPSQPAFHTGLPFTSKAYTFSHTKVTIMPVHYGNPNLLALRQFRFQEASEYHSYVLNSAVQLRISVLFDGHIDTFVQEHWDKKIATHLKNLVKKYPWLAKVVGYDVRIMWEPNSHSMIVAKKKRNIGIIADRMVEVLTSMMDETLKGKKGVLKTELQIGQGLANHYAHQQQPLGLADFVSENVTWQKQVREVRLAHEDFRHPESWLTNLPPHLTRAPKETIDWECHPKGHLLYTKEDERKMDGTVVTVTKPTDRVPVVTRVFSALIGECVADWSAKW
jgi:hypothetical protein